MPFSKILIGVLLVVTSLMWSSTAYGQYRAYDSLSLLLNKEKNPQARVDLLNEIAFALYDFDDSLAYANAQQALQEAQRANYSKGLKQANTMMGLGHFSRGEFREALAFYRKAVEIVAQEAENEDAYVFQMLGKLQYELANYDSALYYYNRALKVPTIEAKPTVVSNIFRNIAQVFLIQWKNEEAWDYLSRSLKLLNSTGNPDTYQLTEIWSLMGTYYENKLDFENSALYFDKMCKVADRDKDYYHLIKCELNQADLQFRKGNYASAISLASEALALSKFYSYPPQVVEIYERFGEIYAELTQHDLATKYFYEALKISERIGLRYRTGHILSELAWIFYERGNLDQGFEYISRAQAIRIEIGDVRGVGNCHNVKGLMHYTNNDFTLAMQEFELARSLWSSIDHLHGVSAIYSNEALIFERRGQYSKALEYLEKTVEIEKRVNNDKELGISYNYIANLYIKMGRLKEAEQYLDMALLLANQSKSMVQKRATYRFLSDLFVAKREYSKAYDAQVKYSQLNDSIYKEASMVKLAEMEALYQIEQKDQKIKILGQQAQLAEKEMALKEAQLNQQRNLATAAIIGFVLISILAITTYRFNIRIKKAHRDIFEQKEEIQAQTEELTESNALLGQLYRQVSEKNEEIQAQSEELIEANQTITQINKSLEEMVEVRTADLKQAYKELDTFFYRSSHDFRRPITTFLGLAEVAKITVKDTNALELFEKVQETATNLDKMLVKLQSISDVGAQHLIFKEVLIEELIVELSDTYHLELERKHIQVNRDIKLDKPFHSYPALVEIILTNLFENAVAFCGTDHPRISLTVRNQDQEVVLTVSDNGQGIDTAVQGRIFDMYFRGNERSKGNGLGLYIVKKAVEKLQGTISFETTVHVGTVFTVRLPNQFS